MSNTLRAAEERKAWVAFMASAMVNYVSPAAASKLADQALDEYRKRFPAPRPMSDTFGEPV